MPKVNLTQARAKAISPPERGQVIHYDSEIQSFGLRVSVTGTKSWVIHKRIAGRGATITLGRFPGVNATDARKLAQQQLGKIAAGANPNALKREQRARAMTLADARVEFKEARRRQLRPKTISGYERMFRSYLGDWLTKPITEINRDMVERRHSRITSEHGP